MNKNKERAIIVIGKKLRGEGNDMTPDLRTPPTNAMGDEVDTEPGITAAADEIIEAVSTKDVEGLKTALRSFLELHKVGEEGEDVEEMES